MTPQVEPNKPFAHGYHGSILPGIEGLAFRSVRAEEDAEALYSVHTGRLEHDRVDLSLHHEDLPSLDGLRDHLVSAIAAGEQDQWRVVQAHDRVVGYSQLASWHEEDGVWVYFIGGWVLPEWRGKGIGTAMLHWGEAMARRLAEVEHPQERFEFAANASCSEKDAAALLAHEDYYVGFTTLEMRFDPSTVLPEIPPLPAGIDLRPMLPEHHLQIVASLIECYYDAFPGNRFRSTFDRVAYFSNELKKPKYDPRFMYVAWDGGEVAGQVFLVIQNGEVYVDQVSVRPAWRRRGLGRALLIRALREVSDLGVKLVWLDTFEEYQTRAVDLYLDLGFYVAKSFGRYRKGVFNEL